MIRDVILCCINLHSDHGGIERILYEPPGEQFVHPSEREYLEKILRILRIFRQIAMFTNRYVEKLQLDTVEVAHKSSALEEPPLGDGLYISAFARGIHTVMREYYADTRQLEWTYLYSPTQSILVVYKHLLKYDELARFLLYLIRSVRLQRLHGCSILRFVQSELQQGSDKLHDAVREIMASVKMVFLQQLSNWLLHAKLTDPHDEFFIRVNQANRLQKKTTKMPRINNAQAITRTYAINDLWGYDIDYQMLPKTLDSTWADMAFFIGQTVLIFKLDVIHLRTKRTFEPGKEERTKANIDAVVCLWGDEKSVFHRKLSELQNDIEMCEQPIIQTIQEIKQFATVRLGQFAVDQVEVVRQLKLIKDYFLLGRGEFYSEFVFNAYTISRSPVNVCKNRDVTRAFEMTGHVLGLTEDMKGFSLKVPKPQLSGGIMGELELFHNLKNARLECDIKWPLHLLFSPSALHRYNELFRFFLRIKISHCSLQMVWQEQISHAKARVLHDSVIVLLRNELLFFLDNLQYYIQVDVLESQFEPVWYSFNSELDIEVVQRAHSVFQANMLSLCFLLDQNDGQKIDLLHRTSLTKAHPAFLAISEILNLCDEFCVRLDYREFDGEEGEQEEEEKDNFGKDIAGFASRFDCAAQKLLTLLNFSKTAKNASPLAQLLLRLDFNKWYTTRAELNKLIPLY